MNVKRWPRLSAMGIASAGGDHGDKKCGPTERIIAVDSGMTIFAKLKTVRDVCLFCYSLLS
jgi:hypothetical protein